MFIDYVRINKRLSEDREWVLAFSFLNFSNDVDLIRECDFVDIYWKEDDTLFITKSKTNKEDKTNAPKEYTVKVNRTDDGSYVSVPYEFFKSARKRQDNAYAQVFINSLAIEIKEKVPQSFEMCYYSPFVSMHFPVAELREIVNENKVEVITRKAKGVSVKPVEIKQVFSAPVEIKKSKQSYADILDYYETGQDVWKVVNGACKLSYDEAGYALFNF